MALDQVALQTSDQIDDIVTFWQQENPDIDVTTKALTLRLRSLSHQLERAMRHEMAALDLEMWELEMLLNLRRSPGNLRRAGELCRLTQVTSGAITNRLTRLEERGWIKREIDPVDRRQVIVTLTPSGLQQANEMIAAKSQAEERFFSGISRATIERLSSDLRELLLSEPVQPNVC